MNCTSPAPPIESSHPDVDIWSLCETATQLIPGCAEAVERSARNVFSANGQPQCRKNVIIVGFPSPAGSRSLGVEGALEPTAGTGDVERAAGKAQDESSWRSVIAIVGLRDGGGAVEKTDAF